MAPLEAGETWGRRPGLRTYDVAGDPVTPSGRDPQSQAARRVMTRPLPAAGPPPPSVTARSPRHRAARRLLENRAPGWTRTHVPRVRLLGPASRPDPPRPPQAAVQPYGVLSETQKRPPSGLACGSTGARAPVEDFTPKTQPMADGTRTSAGFSDAPTGKSRHRLGKSFIYPLVPHALANRRWLVRVTHRQAASDGSKISFGLKRRAGVADAAQPGHEARRTRSCRVHNGDGPSAARSHRGNVCLRFVHRFRNTW